MNKTANFDLPQWEKSDFIQMDDFNAAFGTLDGALKTQADTLAGKAGGEDLTAVRQEDLYGLCRLEMVLRSARC